jgi:hypothetical protein
MLRRAAFICIVPLILGSTVSLSASSLPFEFTGVWISANGDGNECRKMDWKGVAASASDRLINITSRVVKMWEDDCTIV